MYSHLSANKGRTDCANKACEAKKKLPTKPLTDLETKVASGKLALVPPRVESPGEGGDKTLTTPTAPIDTAGPVNPIEPIEPVAPFGPNEPMDHRDDDTL